MKALLALLVVATVAHAKPAIQRVDETLANGLRVIVAPDRTVNSIVVYVRYRGGYTEDANTVVLDQLFADAEHDARLDAIGGYAVSNYEAHHMEVFEVVPAGALELALWFEANRMTREVTSIDAAKAAAIADYKAAYESDDAYAAVDLAIDKLLWAGRGDRRSTPERLAAVTVDELRTLAQSRLSPANATLVIAGRIEPRQALALVRRYFGSISAGQRPALAKEKHVTPEQHMVYVDGAEPATIVVARVSEALPAALVVEQLFDGSDVELRGNEELRITGNDVDVAPTRIRIGSLDEDRVRTARAAAQVKLLLKLETLPYRARVLAAGIDINSLRTRIARVTPEDVREFADLVEHRSVRVEVRRR